MSDEATFHAAFEGASVTVRIDYDRYRQSRSVAEELKTEWHGERSAHIFPQYVAWMHTVMSQIAQRVHDQVLYIYQPPWPGLPPLKFIYYPDGHYEKV